ncbi:hypothetical protein [Actinomadura sp. 9N407]|uniref:hypothetical protein n=1 Tax=Actinomadura sp. 9N407 TaxID=3375154 RepID=UPI0037ADA416
MTTTARDTHAAHTDHAAQTGHAAHGGGTPGGLLISQDGYTLAPDTAILRPGATEFRFRILGPGGEPVRELATIHDKKLHFIVARRDLTSFWHLHPVDNGDGSWSVPLDLPEAGTYRIFTDVAPEALGRTLTLGADLQVGGPFTPRPVPAPARVAAVGPYELTLDGEPTHGEGRRITVTVRENGRPVTDLEPYLAAYGHLVVLRAGDLAYVHVHPDGEPGDGRTEPGPEIGFHIELPGLGTYRLFLDFKHGGTVRTADFTVTTG